MTDRELMQMALDALEELRMEHSQNMKVPEEWYSYYQKQDTALEALRNRLAQPEQVLTARVVVSGSEHKPWCDSVTKLLLSYPPQIPSCNCKQEQGSSSPNYPISESSTPFVDTVNTSQAIVEYDRQGNIAQLFGPIEPDGTLLYAAPPKREWVGLDGDIPGLGLVTEEFYNGMLCAEDILRKRNT